MVSQVDQPEPRLLSRALSVEEHGPAPIQECSLEIGSAETSGFNPAGVAGVPFEAYYTDSRTSRRHA
jgi:hypothetical protein